MTKRISLVEKAHDVIRAHLQEGDAAIDATLGNGYDTLFLARCVGKSGHVYGFDIQVEALQATRARLLEHGMLHRATLFLASHAQMTKHVSQQVQAIMFNLGYLPGADKSIITRSDTTLSALALACQLLAAQGVMTVTAYPGHVGGDEEASRIQQWLQQLNPGQFESQLVFSQHNHVSAPRLFVIRKRV